MKFPHTVTRLRPSGEDEYGNPDKSFADPDEGDAIGFMVSDDLLLCPASADVRTGDRVVVLGRTFAATVSTIRSPSKDVMLSVALDEVGT